MTRKSKVLGIMGSPRKGGNIEALLDKALEGAKRAGAETQKISLADLKITPCQGCMVCRSTGKCVINDDMTHIYPLFLECDAFVFASPMYHKSMSCYFKTFTDRIHGVIADYRRGAKMGRFPVRRYSREREGSKRVLLITSMNAAFPASTSYLKKFRRSFVDFTDFAGIEIRGVCHVCNTWVRDRSSFSKELGKAFRMGERLVAGRTPLLTRSRQRLADGATRIINSLMDIID